MKIKNIPCVILSGGKSNRMGKDKSLLPFDNYDSLIEYQFSRLSNIFEEVFISSKTDKFDFLTDKSKIIFDFDSNLYSPMIALYSILNNIESDKVFIITVDSPFINEDIINQIIKEHNDFDITVAKNSNGTHNLCGLFSKDILNKVSLFIHDNIHQINYLIKNSNSNLINFNQDLEFQNINSPFDYKKSLNSLKGNDKILYLINNMKVELIDIVKRFNSDNSLNQYSHKVLFDNRIEMFFKEKQLNGKEILSLP